MDSHNTLGPRKDATRSVDEVRPLRLDFVGEAGSDTKKQQLQLCMHEGDVSRYKCESVLLGSV